ncbi:MULTISPECIES: type II toxin-antitoxin system prevent-host-death family antitoxin [Pectobacterium]|uniref:type II toxin-antitoxin system prevent-host-death family antitoxin n=1 Tax=Pectobacterium TaxID=122277 RepID=UPI00207F9C40|nr:MULTISPECIES: type II toxin-antitoxin system prevent-host-death family antitoxin [Pectobacterium]UUE57567.1 type II toxin-antitoxin system prevent-host-death family antitoxin [Pectobacterium aroidearum]UUE70272.1 type II toxin-antitoxin system prevent-host-death family antitoxin [Pectobacterium aroidearum]UUE74650.1 type II toxin-antitoxin system prevent-host-death family antitoxin [Pectobacterium aroidearum]UUE78980.1 type II toxin-antitoxin system prevent-host-death family antitoxin [Pecto
MRIDTSTSTGDTAYSKLDTAVEATHKSMKSAATAGNAGVEAYQNIRLDSEFALIMQRHGHTIEALHDR